ncbi:MAG: hypothetical protein SCH66_11535 [Methanolobus sp.]|nr:hypothetical protein [Methanolobus sp.]
MVTGARSNTNKSKKTTSQALSSHDEVANEYEKEGFYSTCGQAFIRISPHKRD